MGVGVGVGVRFAAERRPARQRCRPRHAGVWKRPVANASRSDDFLGRFLYPGALSPVMENEFRTLRSSLGSDWSLSRFEPPRRRWLAWQQSEAALPDLPFVQVRQLLLDRLCRPERKDEVLLALIRLARDHRDAGMSITACLHPGLRCIVWRYRGILDPDDAWSGLAESLTRRIPAFDVERPNRFVAHGLLRDAAHDLRRTARVERAWRDHVRLQEVLPAAAVVPVADVSSDPLDGTCGLTPVDTALIRATRVAGLTLTDAARLLGLSYEAAKKRRQRAEASWVASTDIRLRFPRTATTLDAA